jgi:phage shock protein C
MSEGIKKLYRSWDNRVIAGVCGGIGEYFSVDPTLIRVLFLAFAIIFGGGILLYLLLWLLIPVAPGGVATPAEVTPTDEEPQE